MTDTDARLIADLREASSLFREHPVYDSEGDGVKLWFNAQLDDSAADRLECLIALLNSVPIPGMNEPMAAFYERMNDWLNGPYRAALGDSE